MGSRGLKVRHFLRTWETLLASPDKKMHLRPMRLRDVGPLKIVLPSHANARRVVPLVEPTAPLDLVVIEPIRRTLSDAARAFLEILRARRWASTICGVSISSEQLQMVRQPHRVCPLTLPATHLL
jgi:LysR family transcriptional regulator, nitrogen assimilation regulatory protein